MEYEEVVKTYQTDANFHAMVDVMIATIFKMQLTPAEMRAAAMLASIKVENMQIRPMIIKKDGTSLVEKKSPAQRGRGS